MITALLADIHANREAFAACLAHAEACDGPARTGYPAGGCMSATVVGPSATECDALDTALIVMSPEEGLALVERLSRVECLLVDMEGNVHVSSGLRSGVNTGH